MATPRENVLLEHCFVRFQINPTSIHTYNTNTVISIIVYNNIMFMLELLAWSGWRELFLKINKYFDQRKNVTLINYLYLPTYLSIYNFEFTKYEAIRLNYK